MLEINQCWYCGTRLTDDNRTEDHQIPRSKGGKRPGNLVFACSPCNAKKYTRTVEEYREYLYAATPHGRTRKLAAEMLVAWPQMPHAWLENVTRLIKGIDDSFPKSAFRFYGERDGAA